VVAQKSAKRIQDLPCARCDRSQRDHDLGSDHEYRLATGALDDFTSTEVNAWIRLSTRRRKGEYDVPLPPPEERRRIRERAEWTQQDVGDELEVSRHMVGRWEKVAVGYRGSERLPGREPSGKNRADYAKLLNDLQQFTK
jgi:ribosomal protein L32E